MINLIFSFSDIIFYIILAIYFNLVLIFYRSKKKQKQHLHKIHTLQTILAILVFKMKKPSIVAQPYDEDDDQETLNVNNNPTITRSKNNIASNEIYFQDNRQQPNDQDYQEEASESSVLRRDNNQEPQEPKEEFYFQTRIRNSGFWGKVRLRRGTWLVIVGLILTVIGLVLVWVFWNWWYGHAVNYPCRVVAITVLSLGVLSFIIGIVTNYAIQKEPLTRHFVGSPKLRPTTWILFVSIAMIVIASDAISIYYTYWHNRYVNTPLIIIAIVFYFFGGLMFIFSLYKSVILMRLEMRKAKGYVEVPKKKKKSKFDDIDENGFAHISENEVLEAAAIANQSESVLDQNEANENAEGEEKKHFRKKGLRLQPRTNYIHRDNVQIPPA